MPILFIEIILQFLLYFFLLCVCIKFKGLFFQKKKIIIHFFYLFIFLVLFFLTNIFSSYRKSLQTQTTSLSHQSTPSSSKPVTTNRFIQHSFRNLIHRFHERSQRMRNRLNRPPTPSSSGSLSTSTPLHMKLLFGVKNDDNNDVVVVEEGTDTSGHLAGKQKRQLAQIAVESPMALEKEDPNLHNKCSIFCCCNGSVLDPQGKFYISWLFIVTLSFLYNAFVIPLRTSFPFQTKNNQDIWFAMDVCADVAYLIDLLFIKHRTMYLFQGMSLIYVNFLFLI